MKTYAIQYRADAWQLDPTRWHPDVGAPPRLIRVYPGRSRQDVEAIRRALLWSEDTERVEVKP